MSYGLLTLFVSFSAMANDGLLLMRPQATTPAPSVTQAPGRVEEKFPLCEKNKWSNVPSEAAEMIEQVLGFRNPLNRRMMQSGRFEPGTQRTELELTGTKSLQMNLKVYGINATASAAICKLSDDTLVARVVATGYGTNFFRLNGLNSDRMHITHSDQNGNRKASPIIDAPFMGMRATR